MQTRFRLLNSHKYSKGPIIYWMQREHRVHDNWALLKAQELSRQEKQPFVVIFCLRQLFPKATERLIDFMLGGLKQVEDSLATYKIPFIFLLGDPELEIIKFINTSTAGAIVTEFHSLKTESLWRENIARKINIPFYEVDTRNIVPCWISSDKQEYGAYTIRPKIQRLLATYLTDFPKLEKQEIQWKTISQTDWDSINKKVKRDIAIQKVDWINPGEKEAKVMLHDFLDKKLQFYTEHRNDPAQDAQSNLSPYLHFGHISSQRITHEIEKRNIAISIKEAFLEELVVRRELSDNYCYYNKNYDNIQGFPDWAIKTITDHENDKRPYNYSLEALSQSKTHDRLWNAAQKEMVKNGKMHGYMRMYWAKKIFEWSRSAKEAQKNAIYLNDLYFLDGRDSNGHTGIAWSMGGVHDRAWFERPIFGKIRYMNENGARRKFDVERYIKNCEAL